MSIQNNHIHFVCSGNLYRSRLAEAYLKSKKLQNVTASSSGTDADNQGKGPIIWYALRLIYRNNLLPFMKNTWTLTRKVHLESANIVIFMGQNNFEFCQKWFPEGKKYEVWEIPDFDDRELNGKPLNIEQELEYIEKSEDAFSLITKKVTDLVVTL